MCGLCKSFGIVTGTGDDKIDGLLSGTAWDGPITYAFPASAASYSYDGEADVEFGQATAMQKNAASFALDTAFGTAANDGFSIEGFTGADISVGSEADANIRTARSALPSTSWAYTPGDNNEAGDVWLGTYSGVSEARAGNYAWHTVLHELGHAMGLKHGHEAYGNFGVLPADYDALEMSIMTYRTFQEGPTKGYSYEHWGAPQTYMMADIAALQYMYGADFETNSGDTVYSWKQGDGDTYVNGEKAINAGGDVIFATVWDGGGEDTYSLKGFTSNMTISLEPGASSVFNPSQVPNLGSQHQASGNIYNALQYQGDIRSLIENAIGGKGEDSITGNAADNTLSGGQQGDKLYGHDGNDTLVGCNGGDYLSGDAGNDTLFGGRGNDRLYGGAGDDILTGGKDVDTFIFQGDGGADTITDFRNGQDRIQIVTDTPVVIADIIAGAEQVGEDVLIRISDTETVTLQHFNLSNLDEKDFLV